LNINSAYGHLIFGYYVATRPVITQELHRDASVIWVTAEDGRKLAVPARRFLAKAYLEVDRPAGDKPVLGIRNKLSSGRLSDRFVGQARVARAHLFDNRSDFALAIVQGPPSP
jgi:hypothetical protein